MRLLIIILLFSLSASGNVYYTSPTGNNANSGTFISPFKTLEAAWAVVSAGDTIYLRGGTHAYDDMQYLQSRNGTSNNWIKVWGYPGETAIITRSASYHVVNGVDQDLIYVEGNWLWFQDLEIANFSQQPGEYTYPALRLNPTNDSRFYRIKYHDNMAPMKITGTSHRNVFRDCDFYRNQDPYGSDGVGTDVFDGGDGLVIGDIPASTDTNYVYGCRFWWNADDGLDYWNNQSPTVTDSCWSFWNGYVPGTFTTAGNGSGFKFGPTDQFRKVTRCLASGNRSWGFVENQSLTPVMRFYNNTAVNNGTLNYLFGFWGDGTGIKYFYNNVTQGGGCLFDACGYQLATTAFESTNSWNGFTVNNSDWQSTDSTQLTGARSAVGTLPTITFLRPVVGSDLVNAAASDYGYGDDIGVFQYTAGGNTSPSASAGVDQAITLPTSSVTLTGSGNDPDGSITAYAWTKISGTGGTIVSASSATTSVTGLTAGTYVFRLTVTDNASATGTDDITITVNTASDPPVGGFRLKGKKYVFRNQ